MHGLCSNILLGDLRRKAMKPLLKFAFQHINRRTVMPIAILVGLGSPALADVSITVHLPNGDMSYAAPAAAPMSVEDVMKAAEISFTATYYPGIGYAAVAVSGYPEAVTGGFGVTNWHLCVNGKTADKGMSDMMVEDGDNIDWLYLTNGACPAD